jgi:hypothetical protein
MGPRPQHRLASMTLPSTMSWLYRSLWKKCTGNGFFTDHLWRDPRDPGLARMGLQETWCLPFLRGVRKKRTGTWVIDPVVWDSALQLIIVWTRMHWI